MNPTYRQISGDSLVKSLLQVFPKIYTVFLKEQFKV